MSSSRLVVIPLCLLFTGAFISCKSSTPQVEKVETERADVEPGETVKLTGKNFGEELTKLQVTIGDKEAEIKSAGQGSLDVKLPDEMEAGSHKIVVKNRETNDQSDPVEVKVVVPSPRINAIEPDPARSGSVVQINGLHFNPDETMMEATLDGEKVIVEKATPASIEISVPETLEAGTHNLILTDLNTGKSSEARAVQVMQLAHIPAGAPIRIRTTSAIGTEMNHQGEEVSLVLDSPITWNGRVLAAAGSAVKGRVTYVQQPGKVKGRAAIGFTVESISFVNNQTLAVQTNDFNSQAPSGKKDDAKKIAITTGIGTLVGAIAGGKKGAAIGAATGAAAGTTVVLVTKGDHVMIPDNTSLEFVFQKPVELEIYEPLPSASAN